MGPLHSLRPYLGQLPHPPSPSQGMEAAQLPQVPLGLLGLSQGEPDGADQSRDGVAREGDERPTSASGGEMKNTSCDVPKTNLEDNRIGIDSDDYGVFIWWPHEYFYSYAKLHGGVTNKEYLEGIHEFVLETIAYSKCIGKDPLCPCQDGDMCHYKGPNAWPVGERINEAV